MSENSLHHVFLFLSNTPRLAFALQNHIATYPTFLITSAHGSRPHSTFTVHNSSQYYSYFFHKWPQRNKLRLKIDKYGSRQVISFPKASIQSSGAEIALGSESSSDLGFTHNNTNGNADIQLGQTNTIHALSPAPSINTNTTTNTLPKNLALLIEPIAKLDSVSDRVLKLVALGDQLANLSSHSDNTQDQHKQHNKVNNNLHLDSNRVTMCISKVYIDVEISQSPVQAPQNCDNHKVAFSCENENENQNQLPWRVTLSGDADSKVAKGWLALLVQGLKHETVQQVLQLDPDVILDSIRLNPASYYPASSQQKKTQNTSEKNEDEDSVSSVFAPQKPQENMLYNSPTTSIEYSNSDSVSSTYTTTTTTTTFSSSSSHSKTSMVANMLMFIKEKLSAQYQDRIAAQQNKKIPTYPAITALAQQLEHLHVETDSQDSSSADKDPISTDVQQHARQEKDSESGESENSQRPWYSGVQPEEVAVLLSGGVDSSVAMHLVHQQGFKPIPFYLKIWLQDELAHWGQCPWEDDIHTANQVCQQFSLNNLGKSAAVQLETISMQTQYWDTVVNYTIHEASQGRTPNPDIMCNTRIKFGAFYEQVGKHFNKIVTGHYASTDNVFDQELDSHTTRLLLSVDPDKDQTYFLSNLSQSQLEKACFPVGIYTKTQIRDLAVRFDLPNQNRPDSQGICFLGKLKFDQFLEHHLGQNPGDIVEFETGILVGRHRGFWFYTLGQRKGLGLSHGPWYVVSKNPQQNIVYVSTSYNSIDKPRDSFEFDSASWIRGKPPVLSSFTGTYDNIWVKIRHGPKMIHCEEFVLNENGTSGRVRLELRDKSLAPGQFAVFYQNNVCLGSGVISTDYGLASAPQKITGKAAKNLQAHYIIG